MRRRALLLLAVLAAGCDDPVAPRLPEGARPFTPPAVYARWWAMVESCSRGRGDLAAVRWYVVPGAEFVAADGQRVGGYYTRAAHRVVLAGDGQFAGSLVRHEMLHALRRDGGHPRGAFLGDCGGTVACVGGCVRDAGPAPAPDPAAVRAPASALVLAVTADPAQLAGSTDGGFFAVTVTARNPAPGAVVVELPASGDAGPSVGFSYAADGPSASVEYSERVWDASAAQFGAGEVKRWVFDLRVGSRPGYGELPPGTYRVRGGYSTEWVTSAAPVELRP